MRSCFALIAVLSTLSLRADAISLLDGFVSPPKENYPSIWVFNLGEKCSREVITSDLEEFAKVGISAFTMVGIGADMSAKSPYGDTSLRGKMHGVRADRIVWALHEAHRLGLGVWIMIGPGGCGNSDCPLEHAQKELLLTSVHAEPGPDGVIRAVLPKKAAKETPRNADGSPMRYWDVAALAVPEKEGCVAVEDVVDVSKFLDRASGDFAWTPPSPGKWTVIRAGAVPKKFGFAGCFIDHMSREAFDDHWSKTVTPLLEKLTPDERSAIKGVWCDSWEAGTINWTWNFAEEFRKRRGYDFISMLPVKAGVKMVSRERSRRFARDWNVTIGELIAENHYAYQKDVANRHDLLSCAEGCGPHLHHGDARMIQGRADVAMGEFWMPSPHRPEDSQRFMLRDSATAAHVYGIPAVESEAFTTMGTHWEESPAMFKPCADRAFCEGLTRVCYHGMLMSINPNELPGDTRRAGAYYSPKVTWWKYSAPMNRYFARCSWMLSRGRFAADCLLYAGDAINLFLGMKRPEDGFGPGYDYDLCPTEMLLRARVEGNEIVLPSGMRYKAVFLSDANPKNARMKPGRLPPLEKKLPPVIHPIPEEAVHKLTELERSGATILRTRGDMKRFLDLGSLPQDFRVEEDDSRACIDWIHRILPEGDVYFVANQTNLLRNITVAFRQSAAARVECWDAVVGRRVLANAVSSGRTTRVHLRLPANGSTFVVFLNHEAASMLSPPAAEGTCRSSAELPGDWSVFFDPKWGGPQRPVVFQSLMDWTQHEDSAIRHYSGTAIYRKTFDAPHGCPVGLPVEIDLGNLRDVARVSLNGRALGIAWTPPYAVAVPKLKGKGNALEIEVVNLWPNRLIGDAALPPERRIANTSTSANPFDKNHPLLPSGLYGPVSVIWTEATNE